MASTSINTKPNFRIQFLFEHEAGRSTRLCFSPTSCGNSQLSFSLSLFPGQPTKEFCTKDVGAELTFEAFLQYAIGMTFPGVDQSEIETATFKYQIEEVHKSRWVHFESTAGLGYAIASNESKGYVFISANLVRMGATLSPSPPLRQLVSSSSAVASPASAMVTPVKKKAATVSKCSPAKKKKTTKPRIAGAKGPKVPVEEKILSTLKYLHSINIGTPSRKQIGLLCGYKNILSQGFATALTKLKKEGLIQYPAKGTVGLTEPGIAASALLSTSSDMPKTNADVQERIRSLLSGKEIIMFDLLLDGKYHTKIEIAEAAGYSNLLSQGFTGGLKKLESFDLIEKDSNNKSICLTDNPFPLGRPA